MSEPSALECILQMVEGMADGTTVAIVGPTGSGKSDIADELARRISGEVVSADSMQVYRGMDIGTAKMPPEMRGVAYHCIDIVDPGQPYSAALFQRDSRAAIADIISRGKVPVLCGGTGLYVMAALDDLRFPAGEQEDNPVRRRYERMAEQMGKERLHELLVQRDPRSAELIHPNNVRRVIRALEMHEEGTAYHEQVSGMRNSPEMLLSLRFGLHMDRATLYERIDRRVEAMLAGGLVEEVVALMDRGLDDALTSSQAIGYKEIVGYLEGRCSLREAEETIKRSSRRYAKRQISWFRRDRRIRWVEAG